MNVTGRPGLEQLSRDYATVEKALVYVDQHARRQPDLKEIAAAVGMSEFHFQRLFTQWAGISPKRFLEFVTRERARALLDRSATILQTTHEVGLSSSGRLHDLFINTQAVTPGQYKSGGLGLTIRYGVHPSPFGPVLIGVTDQGICHLGFLRSSHEEALDQLSLEWNRANITRDQAGTRGMVSAIFELDLRPRRPLHVLLGHHRHRPGRLGTRPEPGRAVGDVRILRPVSHAPSCGSGRAGQSAAATRLHSAPPAVPPRPAQSA